MESSQTFSEAHHHPHYYVTEVNKIHQENLLFLPHDKVYQNTYKYTLNVIDVVAVEVAEMFEDIYKKGPLKYPKEFYVDITVPSSKQAC